MADAAVKDSWGKLTAGGFEDAGAKVFKELLKNPTTKALFPKFKDIPDGQIEGNAAVRAHGKKVCEVIDAFVNGGGDDKIKAVATNHKKLGLANDKVGSLMKEALVAVLNSAGLGSSAGAWDAAWSKFMAVHGSVY